VKYAIEEFNCSPRSSFGEIKESIGLLTASFLKPFFSRVSGLVSHELAR